MSTEIIDLRSDTVAKPSQAMRAAMASAEVGDDGRGEDPTVTRLEELLADAFGFTGALFLPSGVMGNQLGLRLLVPPGQEVLADSNSHFLLYEDAGVAWQGGIQTRTAVTADGLLDPDTLAGMVHVSEPYSVSTRAIAVENTHNVGGGTVYPVERLRAIRAVADAAELKIHCDGARIWNAAVASGTSLREYGKYADTLSVGLSKGLGAPAGTVLLFDAEYADQARVFRHRMGGSMRQSGILAAACIYAFEHNVERMADDHANARLIAGILGEHGLDVSTPETNIVLVQVPDAAAVTEACQAAGVRVSRLNAKLIRLVTHLDVDARQCEQAAHTLGKLAAEVTR